MRKPETLNIHRKSLSHRLLTCFSLPEPFAGGDPQGMRAQTKSSVRRIPTLFEGIIETDERSFASGGSKSP
jgi:hypothetical protein